MIIMGIELMHLQYLHFTCTNLSGTPTKSKLIWPTADISWFWYFPHHSIPFCSKTPVFFQILGIQICIPNILEGKTPIHVEFQWSVAHFCVLIWLSFLHFSRIYNGQCALSVLCYRVPVFDNRWFQLTGWGTEVLVTNTEVRSWKTQANCWATQCQVPAQGSSDTCRVG